MPDQQLFRNRDLLLQVTKSIDPVRLNIEVYERFLDVLCGTREYQKEAIRTVLRYLLGGRYQNLRQLARENYQANTILQERYASFQELERHLQLPNQLSCTVDLATATGKSYVMYGIARIMLAHGAVDRVLVLCPSRTIEKGLLSKFRQLSQDASLKDVLPENTRVRMPSIITGSESIVDGAICIENFHATLEHVGSSIRDSLRGKGERTLILNDEAHHVYNPSGKDLKRWKEFLIAQDFTFRYIVGFSGTCYVGDDYFSDVVTRYSLRQAIEDGYVKSIDYVAEDSPGSQEEKFQKIYDNHIQNKTQFYRKVKPLTILITRDISACKKLTDDLISFLARHENIPVQDAARKVLIVTSSREHEDNVELLEKVDASTNPIEWITSVSMLTEGWDVQNVFQIVPHEKRAFDSKLLIAQVLGRGLRVPDPYRGERPVVVVFNHDAWSSRIKHLVDEVMEIEKRVYSYPVSKSTDYNFTLHHLKYDKEPVVETFEHSGGYEFAKGYITLASQEATSERETIYTRATTGEQRPKKTLVRYQMYSVEQVAEHVHNHYSAIDLEDGASHFAELYPLDWLCNIIRTSLRRVGESQDIVSADNRQRILAALGITQRGSAKRVRHLPKADDMFRVNTAERQRNSAGLASIRHSEATIFLDDDTIPLSDDETRIVLEEILADETLPRSAFIEVNSTFCFKTPLNLVITERKPEREFVRNLITSTNAVIIDAWIKSTDQEFYPIAYVWRKGEHPKPGLFNPDFFIKVSNHIFVIEIKGDEEIAEPSDENKAKFKAARQHFAMLNDRQSEIHYHFHFLTPINYGRFFRFLKDQNYQFVSDLDAALES